MRLAREGDTGVHFDLGEQVQEITPVVRDESEVLVKENRPEFVAFRTSQAAVRNMVSLEASLICDARQFD